MDAENSEKSVRRKTRSICYFLLSLLEDESYPHVQWTDKKKGEFQIHWKHASSGAWVMHTDAETFRLWAKAKGKLKGREANYKTWKANFRCAMKSRHELQEVKIPEGSPYKKKNVKLWRFIDTEIVNRYEAEGEKFDWERPNTRTSSRRSSRTTRLRQRRRTVDEGERTDSDENESFQDNSAASEQQCINTDNDDAYRAGLLQILEQDQETDSVVPEMSVESYPRCPFPECDDRQTETMGTAAFSQGLQLPSFHSFMEESPFSDDIPLDEDWHLFADEEYGIQHKEEGITATCLDIPWDDLEDPLSYENTYVEL